MDFTEFDVGGICTGRGLAVVDPADLDRYRQWLNDRHYSRSTVDFANGIGAVVFKFGELFRWHEQFGYSLTTESRNLDALRDGFGFCYAADTGHVLEMLNGEIALAEDKEWFLGLLSICSEYSHTEMSLGKRFFTTLISPKESSLIGQTVDRNIVPWPFQFRPRSPL
jgi:hypothetical protein